MMERFFDRLGPLAFVLFCLCLLIIERVNSMVAPTFPDTPEE